MRALTVDGIPTFHVEGPAKTTALLFLGVGMRDEPFSEAGITHLVEHLAMSALPKSHLDANAAVDVDHTVFSASGRPQEVAAFLEAVCRALADLPLQHLEREASVLLAEDCPGVDLTMAAAWAARFGMAGPGVAVTPGAGPQALTAGQVLAHARRWAVAGNAALAVVGPLPQDLRLPLPAGRPPVREVPAAREQDGPGWVQGPCDGVGLLLQLDGPWDPAHVVAVEVLVERLEDVARTRHGLSYSVQVERLDLGTADLVTLAVDAREGRAGQVAGLVWAELGDLAAHGPTAAELQHAVEGLRRRTDPEDPDALEAEAPRAAYDAVIGRPFRPVAELAAGWAGVTGEQVAAVLAAARRGALVVVPPEERLEAADVAERTWCRVGAPLPPGRSYRPPALARMFVRGTRQRLVVGEDALGLRDAEGDEHLVGWDEVVGAVPTEDGKGVSVVGRELCVIDVHPDLFGRPAFEQVRARLAEHGHPVLAAAG